jgi:multidrug resistance efflux pump
MRGKWVLIGVSIILGAIAIGALSSLWQTPKKPAVAQQQTNPAATDPFPSGTEISLEGTVEAQQTVDVSSKVTGILSEVFFEPGQEVYEGQLIARVQNRKLESERDRAKEDLESLQTKLNNAESSLLSARLEASRARAEASRVKDELSRLEKLYQRQVLLNNQGATPRNKFEQAQREFQNAQADSGASLSKAEIAEQRVTQLTKEIEQSRKTLEDKSAAVEEAEADLKAADIVSPVDGIFLGSNVDKGEQVSRDMEDLFQIAVDLSKMQVVVEPNPQQLAKMKPGLVTQVFMAESGNEALPGEIASVKDNQVLVVFLSPTAAIKPGLTAQVRIKLP